MIFFRILAVTVAAVLSTLGVAAHAQATAYAPGQGSVNNVVVKIPVRASVQPRCGFTESGAPSGTIDQANFDQTGFSRDFAIALNCTSASRIAVSSRNGGLLPAASTSSGYASKAPFDVALRMVADNGTVATASCAADQLVTGGSCAFAGTASSSAGLRLSAASTKANGSYLRVSAPAYAAATPLVAGGYADTLTVTISVAP